MSLARIGRGARAAAHAEPLAKLRVAYDGFSMTSAPLHYADQQGLFKKFGLDVTPIFVEGGSLLTQAVVRRLGRHRAERLYARRPARRCRAPTSCSFGGHLEHSCPFQLVVKSSIAGAADLKGQSIAISRFGSSTDTAPTSRSRISGSAARRAHPPARRAGRPATRDHDRAGWPARSSNIPTRPSWCREGSGHGRTSPTSRATIPNTSYVTSRTFLKKNPELVKRSSWRWRPPSTTYKRIPDLAIKLTRTFLNVKDEANARAAYESYSKCTPTSCVPRSRGIALVLQELAKSEPKVAGVKPQDIVDTSALDELKREGFFTKLAAQH